MINRKILFLIGPKKREAYNGIGIKSSLLELGAYAILWFDNGVIDHLEIFSNNGEYPSYELTDYCLTKDWQNSPERTILSK